jgi:transcriptional regulator with XRE-family HTH domain
MTRPTFYPQLAKFFKALRAAHNLNQRQAGQLAERRGLDLTYEVIRGLERGGVRRIDQTTLRAIASLYRLPYETIAAEVIQHVYGLSVSFGYDTDKGPTIAARPTPATTVEEAIEDIRRASARLMAVLPESSSDEPRRRRKA